MKLVIFHAEAEVDLREAIAYYETQRKGLGRELRLEIEATTQRLQRNPKLYPLHDRRGTRKAVVHRFPYTIFFAELEDSLWVAAVAHHKRRPSYWRKRRPE